VDEAAIRYRLNDRPRRGLAVAGIFGIKAFMALPHFIIVGALQYVAAAAAYIGYFLVAFTGRLPMGLQDFMAWWLRWWTRTIGWYTGVNDVYPPFEPDPADYLPDADIPRNSAPSRGWAVAGICLVKFLAVIHWLILAGILMSAVMVVSWIGFFVAAFTGRLPLPLHDFYLGTTQFMIRVMSWILGLTDRYPRFDLEIHPVR
jgi:hypothetical protein